MLMGEWQSWPTVLRAYTAAQHLGLITVGELFTVGEPFGQLASPLLSWRALCSEILETRVGEPYELALSQLAGQV